MKSRLTSNSLHSSSPSLPGAGIIGLRHHSQLLDTFFKISFYSQPHAGLVFQHKGADWYALSLSSSPEAVSCWKMQHRKRPCWSEPEVRALAPHFLPPKRVLTAGPGALCEVTSRLFPEITPSQGIALEFAPHHMILPQTSLLEPRGLHIPTRSSQGHLVTRNNTHRADPAASSKNVQDGLTPCRFSHRIFSF